MLLGLVLNDFAIDPLCASVSLQGLARGTLPARPQGWLRSCGPLDEAIYS
jgi:hypothetical protein